MDKKVMLIADDVEMNRSVIKRFFKKDYEVLEAADGKEALRQLYAQHIDILLLDIIMPEMNGIEVLEKVRSDAAYDDVAILVATSVKEKTERQALNAGADDVVSKPYDPVILRKRLDNILAQKELKKMKLVHDFEAVRDMAKQEYLAMFGDEIMKKSSNIDKLVELMRQNLDNQELLESYLNDVLKQTRDLSELTKKNV